MGQRSPSCSCCGCVRFSDAFSALANWTTDGDVQAIGSQMVISGVGYAVLSRTLAGGGKISFSIVGDSGQTSGIVFGRETSSEIAILLAFGDVDGSPCGQLDILLTGVSMLDRPAEHFRIQDGQQLAVDVFWDETRVLAHVYTGVPSVLGKRDVTSIAVDHDMTALGTAALETTDGVGSVAFDNFIWLRPSAQGEPCYDGSLCVFGSSATNRGWLHHWKHSDWLADPNDRCDVLVTMSGANIVKLESRAAVLTSHDRRVGYTVSTAMLLGVPFPVGEYYLANLAVGDHEVRLYGIVELLYDPPPPSVDPDGNYLHVRFELWANGAELTSRTFSYGHTSYGPASGGFTLSMNLTMSLFGDLVCVSTGYPLHNILAATTSSEQVGSDIVLEVFGVGSPPTTPRIDGELWAFRCWTCQGCVGCDEQDGVKSFESPLQITVEFPPVDSFGIGLPAPGTFLFEYISHCRWRHESPGVSREVTLEPFGFGDRYQWRVTDSPAPSQAWTSRPQEYVSGAVELCDDEIDVPLQNNAGPAEPVAYLTVIV